ncbi:MAG: hypothetical protein ACXV8U_17935 [Methylobacter sp.]
MFSESRGRAAAVVRQHDAIDGAIDLTEKQVGIVNSEIEGFAVHPQLVIPRVFRLQAGRSGKALSKRQEKRFLMAGKRVLPAIQAISPAGRHQMQVVLYMINSYEWPIIINFVLTLMFMGYIKFRFNAFLQEESKFILVRYMLK